MATTSNPRTTAALVLLGGAVVMLVGAFLTWWRITTLGEAENVVGTDSTPGAATAGFAVMLVIAAIVMWVRARNGLGRGWAIAAIALSAFALGVALYSAAAPEAAVVTFEASDVADQMGVSEEIAADALRQAIDAGQIEIESAPGGWVGAVGALVALAGGILGVRALPRRPAAAPATAPPGAVPPPPPAP